jgi:hypothetical protein
MVSSDHVKIISARSLGRWQIKQSTRFLKKLDSATFVIGKFISNRKERILFKGKRKQRLPRFDRDEITQI